jgi:hypothetical protein
MEITMDLTVALQGELCDDLAMLYALENGDNSISTEPFTITFADPDDEE